MLLKAKFVLFSILVYQLLTNDSAIGINFIVEARHFSRESIVHKSRSDMPSLVERTRQQENIKFSVGLIFLATYCQTNDIY